MTPDKHEENTSVDEYPLAPATFINEIIEEGTKQDAVECLQKTWNELCFLKKKISEAMTPDKHDARVEAAARAIVHPLDRIYFDGYRPDEHLEQAAERLARLALAAADAIQPAADKERAMQTIQDIGQELEGMNVEEALHILYEAGWTIESEFKLVKKRGDEMDSAHLLQDMREQAEYTDCVRLPIPLYEKIKTTISAMQPAAVHPAMQAASEILERFATPYPSERPKIEEWEACYAMLFKQLNDIHNKPAAVREWMPIETAPRDWSCVLAYVPRLGIFTVRYMEESQETQAGWQALCTMQGLLRKAKHKPYEVDSPTHWMPLPTAPNQTGEGEK